MGKKHTGCNDKFSRILVTLNKCQVYCVNKQKNNFIKILQKKTQISCASFTFFSFCRKYFFFLPQQSKRYTHLVNVFFFGGQISQTLSNRQAISVPFQQYIIIIISQLEGITREYLGHTHTRLHKYVCDADNQETTLSERSQKIEKE